MRRQFSATCTLPASSPCSSRFSWCSPARGVPVAVVRRFESTDGSLSLLVVTIWLKSEKRSPHFALWPMLFMYITTIAATCVTARNL